MPWNNASDESPGLVLPKYLKHRYILVTKLIIFFDSGGSICIAAL